MLQLVFPYQKIDEAPTIFPSTLSPKVLRSTLDKNITAHLNPETKVKFIQETTTMPFGLVSAWNKRLRSKSQDHTDPWTYKPVEFWQLEDQIPHTTKRHHGSTVFTLKEMEEATCSFSDENYLGKGGFGRVYRGVLRSGEVVAIKKMELPPFKEAEGEREFRVEVDILSRLNHPNLVSLIGYCADGKHRFLAYEYLMYITCNTQVLQKL